MWRKILLAMAMVAGGAAAARADQLVMKNGDRLTGKIVRSDARELTLQTLYAGAVKVQRAAIASITSDQSLNLFTNDGQRYVGKLAAENNHATIKTADSQVMNAALETIAIIRSSEEQARFEAEEARYRNPGMFQLWNTAFDFGMSLVRGNSDALTFAGGFTGERATRRDKTTTYFSAVRASGTRNGTRQTIASLARFGGRYESNLSERNFAFASVDVEYNRAQRLHPRLVLGGGVGRHLLKNERTKLDLFGGMSSNHEFFTDGNRRQLTEALFREELTHKLNKQTSVTQKFALYPNLTKPGEFRANVEVSTVTALTKHFSWYVNFGNRYISNPLPNTQPNDLLLTTGIRATFGRK
jgi:putative salt-induced outer membrane protein YdiY